MPRTKHLWLCQATEVDGERERLRQFLVRATTENKARKIALGELRQEWGVSPDKLDEWDKSHGVLFSYFGGEILMKDLTIPNHGN